MVDMAVWLEIRVPDDVFAAAGDEGPPPVCCPLRDLSWIRWFREPRLYLLHAVVPDCDFSDGPVHQLSDRDCILRRIGPDQELHARTVGLHEPTAARDAQAAAGSSLYRSVSFRCSLRHSHGMSHPGDVTRQYPTNMDLPL